MRLSGSSWVRACRPRSQAKKLADPLNSFVGDVDINCENSLTNYTLDWPDLRRRLGSEGKEWLFISRELTHSQALTGEDADVLFPECPIGYTAVSAAKILVCAGVEPVCFDKHASRIERLLFTHPPHIIAASSWKLPSMLHHVRWATARHPYHLDFPRSTFLTGVQSASLNQLFAYNSPSATDTISALWKMRFSSSRTAVVSMVYGNRFNMYIDRFVRRARNIGIEHLILFTLDSEAYVICRAAGTALCIRGTPNIINKFTLPLMLVRAGIDVLWVDFDVFLFKNPIPHLQDYSDQFDILISDSFSTRCICNGVVFFRSVPIVEDWLLALAEWMYKHPYEHDQKAVSAFLHAGEVVAEVDDLPVGRNRNQLPIPRWGYLDGGTEFATAKHVEDTGWTGNPDSIVLLHFLHGDSDAAFGVSPAESRGSSIIYRDLMATFYGVSDEQIFDTSALPHVINSTIREVLYESFWSSRPRWRPICTGAVPHEELGYS